MMDTSENVNLSGILKKVLYFNEENNYCIAVLENNQKICGSYFDTDLKKLEGVELLLKGKWITHDKYGVQFSFESLEIKEEEIYFFLTKIVKGISKKLAIEITAKYNDEQLANILDNTPSELLQFKGIKEKKLTQIVSSWNKFKHLRELADFLGEYGVTKNLINKVYQEFASIENLIQKIKDNPYMLIAIKGIGFKRADEIATNLGIPKDSQFRIMACINYTLREFCESNGNSSIDKEELYKLLDDALYFNDKNTLYENAIIDMLANDKLHETSKNRFAPGNLFFAEKKVLDFFQSRANNLIQEIIIKDFDKYIDKKESSLGFKLSIQQKQAVAQINSGESVIALIGYAGTGKSTSSKAILELLQEIHAHDEIHCIALSGIAAQRISDTTGYRASTIQSLFMANKEKDYFPYKVLLLDEASMVNSVTFYQLISKISDDTKFIIVGDDGQLPAIGAGDVLGNIIKHELCPITKLTKIYRQDEHQAIAFIANEIRKGCVPELRDDFIDFKFKDVTINNYYALKNTLSQYEVNTLRNENNLKIANEILNTASNYITDIHKLREEKNIKDMLTKLQVITPMKNGVLGVENLNINLQKLLNNNKNKFFQGTLYQYKIADKVIHIKNENMKSLSMSQYKSGSIDFIDKRIFNGMLGMIIKLDFEEKKCVVLYPNDDRVVFYDFANIENLLSLAYCLTIHKTQGMEYDTALIPMSFSHFIMHNTKLLYTAITRAKNMCYVVGERDTFDSACKKIEITKRQTVINDLLTKEKL